jgi:hypothetical protein
MGAPFAQPPTQTEPSRKPGDRSQLRALRACDSETEKLRFDKRYAETGRKEVMSETVERSLLRVAELQCHSAAVTPVQVPLQF